MVTDCPNAADERVRPAIKNNIFLPSSIFISLPRSIFIIPPGAEWPRSLLTTLIHEQKQDRKGSCFCHSHPCPLPRYVFMLRARAPTAKPAKLSPSKASVPGSG